MRTSRKVHVVTGALAALVLAACSSTEGAGDESGAEDAYPTDRIRLVIPFAPGGGTDTTVRAVAPCMEDELDEIIVIENLEGANATRGANEIIQSESDGYTIGLAINTGMTVTPMVEDVTFTKDDITPIAALFEFGVMIAGPADGEIQDAESLIAAAESRPGEVRVAVTGTTGPTALAFRALEQVSGLDFNVIPFQGAADVNNALLGGQVDVAGLAEDRGTLPYLEAGDYVTLGSFSKQRWYHAPEAPTVTELGYADATIPPLLFFLHGPQGMPENAVSTLEAAVETCLEQPDVVEALGGPAHVPSPFMGSAEVTAALDEAQEVFARILEP